MFGTLSYWKEVSGPHMLTAPCETLRENSANHGSLKRKFEANLDSWRPSFKIYIHYIIYIIRYILLYIYTVVIEYIIFSMNVANRR